MYSAVSGPMDWILRYIKTTFTFFFISHFSIPMFPLLIENSSRPPINVILIFINKKMGRFSLGLFTPSDTFNGYFIRCWISRDAE